MTTSFSRSCIPVILLAALGRTPVAAQQPTSAAATSSVGGRPALRVGTANGNLRLDGVLDEPAWAAADSIADLTQIEPVEGGRPTGRTVVRVLASSEAIIFGVRADDPEAARITSFARDRDAILGNEDHIRLVLDTYLDGRSGYVFMVNPNGARYDALVANQGEGENANWDAVWEAATSVTPNGWSAEIRIPIKSLLFRPGLTQWGFNVQRRVQRLQEHDRWASPDRDVKINMTSRAGLLTDVPAFDLGLGLSVRPALTASAGQPAPATSTRTEQDVSLDVTQRLGANTLASLTVNTDFAETEVDTRRTNLTRFPLVFPEKRTFFLEGSDVFDFGLGASDDVRAFFSRRIGLLSQREVPLDAGLKINGRQGGTSYGALVVRTGNVDTLPTDNTMGVIRVRKNVLRESSVGAIASFGDPLGRDASWLAGADVTYQTTRFRGDKNLIAGAWGLAMDREDLTGRRHAIGGRVDYPNDLWDIALSYKWIGDDFDPSLGFVPRPGVQIVNFNMNYQPRPTRPILGLGVRQMFHEFENRLVTDLDGKWESYRIFTAPINWRLESGDRFEFNFVPTGERLVEPFEIAKGVVIPAGSHHWARWRLEGGLASKRKVSGQLTWWFGNFYTGKLDELSLTASWKPSPLFIVELNGTRNDARLAEGSFTQQVVGTRFRVNVSPDLQVNSYLQYDDLSETFGTNTRLRWTFAPQGDLFVVYNHNVNELVNTLDRHRGWRFASNQLLVKLQYAFRY
ncbi:MAG TPA: DUF5916 domain-containing protein [Gemmatimonadaceae bacterium]|nr:DUF5916 domain-containing protein [Gemmatimonadaceae bacterium]